MAWYDSLAKIDWGGMLSRAIPAAYGAYTAGKANEQAAQAIAESNRQAAAMQLQASQQAQARLDAMAERSAPAVTYLQRVMSDSSLTPGQQQRIADTRTKTGQMLSSRLGGRSATAIATRAAQGLEHSIYDANRSRSDRAAGALAGENSSAIRASVDNDLRTGGNLANITMDTGRTAAQAGLSTAQMQAKSVGDVVGGGDTLGAIRSIIAENRKGNYDGWKPGAE